MKEIKSALGEENLRRMQGKSKKKRPIRLKKSKEITRLQTDCAFYNSLNQIKRKRKNLDQKIMKLQLT